jgi:hypothetical protein
MLPVAADIEIAVKGHSVPFVVTVGCARSRRGI